MFAVSKKKKKKSWRETTWLLKRDEKQRLRGGCWNRSCWWKIIIKNIKSSGGEDWDVESNNSNNSWLCVIWRKWIQQWAWLLILEEIAFLKSTACNVFAFTESQLSGAVYYGGGQSAGRHRKQAMLEWDGIKSEKTLVSEAALLYRLGSAYHGFIKIKKMYPLGRMNWLIKACPVDKHLIAREGDISAWWKKRWRLYSG